MNTFDTLAFNRRIEYRARQVAAQVILSCDFLEDNHLDHVVEYINGQIAIAFSKKIYCRDIGGWERKQPATVWDHFKHVYFPDWLKKRFPVTLLTERIAIEEVLDKTVTAPTLYMVRYE